MNFLRSLFLLAATAVACGSMYAQDAGRKSALRLEYEEYSKYGTPREWDSVYRAKNPGLPPAQIRTTGILPAQQGVCKMKKRVFGWQPFWVTPANDHDYSALTDLSYFGYDVNASTGGYTSIHDWLNSPIVTKALNAGIRVNLCVILFSDHSTFLNSASSKQNLITNVINLVKQRKAHGVNIDFEGMSPSHSSAFASFMIDLAQQMHNAVPGSEVSIALPAGNWSGTYSASMVPYVDLFLIMGYDFHWSTSPNAGPVAPKHSGGFWTNSDITNSITYYLKNGIPSSKLCLGVPYYGYDWPTSSSALKASTTGQAFSRRYTDARQAATTYGRKWDNYSATPYFTYTNSGPRQCWYDDETSLGLKYDVVNMFNLAGIGIWALGYDDGSTTLWNLLREKFSDCAPASSCSGTLTDLGGPGNYYNNETWTYTIAPSSASSVTLTFSSFSTEANYDFLYIYDGPSAASPLIGKYSGSTSPGTVTASSGVMTLRFTSDEATTAAGWNATWNCSVDNTAPTTSITAPTGWITQNFSASFSDADNAGGSGLNKSLYHVVDYDGSQWRANPARGFFRDNFDASLHSDWTSSTGSWANSAGVLVQSDESISNTILSAPLTQNLSNRYLYHFSMKIEGAGTNRRAGLHLFCDNASAPNRGNSYLVWFRADQGSVEVYKSLNDVLGNPLYVFPLTISPAAWHDVKISFDRSSGKMDIYFNNVLEGSWTDSAPLSSGSFVSFRSGNCSLSVNNFYVYRSRGASASISVGASGDMRYQSPAGANAGMIKSIVVDNAGNFSSVASQSFKVDWSAPASVAALNDGNAADIDLTSSPSQLSANWNPSSDPHSAVAKYWYAIGTSPGAVNITNWTDNGTATSVTKNGLALTPGTTYYFSVKAENAAGLQSPISSSDGQKYEISTGGRETGNISGIMVYPNPVSDRAVIRFTLSVRDYTEILVTDLLGKEHVLFSGALEPGEHQVILERNFNTFPAGVYVLKIKNRQDEWLQKLICR